MITAKSLGVLLHIAGNPLQGGAEALCEVFQEGRDSLQKSINELKKAGMVSMKTYKIPGGYYRSLELTEKGHQYLEDRVSKALNIRASTQQYELNSNINIYANLANKQERVLEEVEETFDNKINLNIGGKMSFLGQMDNDPDEVAERRRKDKERRKTEYLDAKEKVATQRTEDKRTKTPAEWSSVDVAYEFAERMRNLWHVRPWTVAKTSFKIALTNARKENDTDGEIENKMMDLYFMQIAHETKLNNPEIIWKRFILQFANLSVEARRSMVTPEDMATEKELARRSREKMKNV